MSQPHPSPDESAAVKERAGKTNRRTLLLGLLLLAVVVAAYLPALDAGFVWDDDSYVTKNDTLLSGRGLWRIWAEPRATPQYYPMVFTTFWLEHRLWGFRPLGYHAVNVALHALVTVLLWLLLRSLAVPGAWLGAALFGLHPIQAESVAWVTERKNVLSGLFFLSSAAAYARFAFGTGGGEGGAGEPGRREERPYYALSLLLFLCALLSKSVTATLPAALLLVIWWKRGRVSGRDLALLAPFFALGAAAGIHTAWLEASHVGARGADWDLTAAARVVLAGRVLWFYAAKIVVPRDFSFIYPRWEVAAGGWQVLYPVAAALTVLLLWALRRLVGRGPLTAALCYAVLLAPALGFVNVYPMRFSWVADHFQYLAGMALFALAGAAFRRSRETLGALGARWGSPRAAQTAFSAAAVSMCLTLGAMTWTQCLKYRDPGTLWEDTVARNPGAWLAENNLGAFLYMEGDLDGALVHYRRALALRPDYDDAWYNLALLLKSTGREKEAEWAFARAQTLRLDHIGRREEAEAFLDALLSRSAEPSVLFEQGNYLAGQGLLREAGERYRKAIDLDPAMVDARINLALVLVGEGRVEEGVASYRRALSIAPDDAGARLGLGNLLLDLGRTEEAETEYREVLRLDGRSAKAMEGLGVALWRQGLIAEAEAQFRGALAADPAGAAAGNLRALLAGKAAPPPAGTSQR